MGQLTIQAQARCRHRGSLMNSASSLKRLIRKTFPVLLDTTAYSLEGLSSPSASLAPSWNFNCWTWYSSPRSRQRCSASERLKVSRWIRFPFSTAQIRSLFEQI